MLGVAGFLRVVGDATSAAGSGGGGGGGGVDYQETAQIGARISKSVTSSPNPPSRKEIFHYESS